MFAAQFALSHACWLCTYPLAGWALPVLGMPGAMLLLGGLAIAGTLVATLLWEAGDPRELEHEHRDLAPDHPHLCAHGSDGRRHRHVLVIDDYHAAWPRRG